MRRHPQLLPLSRDHHAALSLGRRLIGGGGHAQLAAMLSALQTHFRDEERDLRPQLEARSERTLAQRLSIEHAAFEILFEAALRGKGLAEVGQALIDHVRFEERVLFPRLEVLLEESVP